MIFCAVSHASKVLLRPILVISLSHIKARSESDLSLSRDNYFAKVTRSGYWRKVV